MKTGRTCDVHFTDGQRSQVGRVECIETAGVHLGHAVPSVEFVVEIQAHLHTVTRVIETKELKKRDQTFIRFISAVDQ